MNFSLLGKHSNVNVIFYHSSIDESFNYNNSTLISLNKTQIYLNNTLIYPINTLIYIDNICVQI